MLPAGLKNSHLAQIFTEALGSRTLRRNNGVRPTKSNTSSATRSPFAVIVRLDGGAGHSGLHVRHVAAKVALLQVDALTLNGVHGFFPQFELTNFTVRPL